ncbi:imidazole glycerol phosphate synthase subunit HisH [Rhodoblastus sp.]|uniref:imidazole glycerol phosphate synthase subunit HisH n=1 Tax=Rhodoblastus sp. TaxID=1962975 RepID=UPI0025DC49CF|nr:imidazole glycerol phosphate synthase subunit HisH [Rhodoblastus sp.]
MNVAIIDYGSGNLHSAAKAFERASRESGIDAAISVTADSEAVRRADRIVLPGVGAFADCRRGLLEIEGMAEALEDAVRKRGAPFLGICVGMQLLAERGLEHGDTPGLGWIGGAVVPIKPSDPNLKIPHMGWNNLDLNRPHPVLEGIATGPDGLNAYFVHSYHLLASNPDDVIATTEYGGALTAMVGRDTIVGVQFHPEKSQSMGLRLISNFLRWRP